MTEFRLRKTGRVPKLIRAVAIEGLPGIANVGKIAVDYIVKSAKARPFLSLTSDYFPSTVYIEENNSVKKAGVEFNYARINHQDFIFITGNSQPTSEPISYRFARTILLWLKRHNCQSLITTGGIGLVYLPEKPKIYCAGNDANFIKEFKKFNVITQLYGKISSISGATGLLLSLADEYGIKAISLLAETLAHPFYLGINSAKELVLILNSKFRLGLKKEKIERDFKEAFQEVVLPQLDSSQKSQTGGTDSSDYTANYIG